MALTQAEKNEMLNAIKAESQSVDELATVASLDGVNSLPAIRGTEVVNVPVSLLRKPAEDAAKTANSAAAAANKAAQDAEAAITEANQAAQDADTAAGNADAAAGHADRAVAEAKAVVAQHEQTAVAGRKGATVRLAGFTDLAEVETDDYSTETTGLPVYFDIDKLLFYVSENRINLQEFPEKESYVDPATNHPYECKIYLLGEAAYIWDSQECEFVEISGGSGSGSGFYNLTEEQPLTTGYYTLETAVAALAEADIDDERKRGMIITFEESPGKWADYRFIGTTLSTFLTAGAWEEFGAKNVVKKITVNGEVKTPDADGNVSLTIDKVETDSSFDVNSDRPIQNGVVATKVSELEASTLFDNETEENDDGSTTVRLLSKTSVITEFTVKGGGGGGGGDEASTTKIVLSASVDKTTIKAGDPLKLTYTYDHQYSGGDDKGQTTGQKATIQITARRGTISTYNETKQDVSAGTYTVDLTKYILLGTTDIYVVATTTDPNTGKQQKKQAYINVKAVTLSLSSSYNISSGLANGGFSNSDTIEIPYSVNGSGTKAVALYVDGVQRNLHSVTRSGTTNDTFRLAMSGLNVGRHTVQMVAEMEQDGLTLKSESIYFDIFKRGSGTPFIGTKMVHADGRILTGTAHSTPTIEAGQYEKCEFDFVAYDPTVVPATVQLWLNGKLNRTVAVNRTTQNYSTRFTEKGKQTIQLKIGSTSYLLDVDVTDSGIDISEASYGLQFKLDANGRSNEESNPAEWESNGVTTTFEGVDFGSSGWIDGALKLTNGAKITVNTKPFERDVKSTGLTIEMTMRVSNVMSKGASIVSCLDKGKGLLITTEEASFRTGQTVTYTNEDDKEVSREIKLATNYAAGDWMKVALTIGTTAQDRLMQLYVDGNRAGADIYDSSFSFQQDTPQAIMIDSSEADVEIKSIRVYNRALDDDEELENRIVDSETTDEMMDLYSFNDILNDNDEVDMDKIRAMGKGVLRIVRKNMLDDVYETNNKKTDFLADVYFYSALGEDYNFILTNCYIRIQGTSSTKYPSKNIRIYFTKGSEMLSMSGKNVLPGNKYRMRPGAVPVPIVCCKSDYSDSSMSLNTGGAKLFNDVMKELGLLTPPQRHQYEQGGNSLGSVNVRTAIDGMPIDIFCAETADGENVYYGQYNFNNEKSKSGPVFGMEDVEGYTPECPIALEMLNNTSPICLFSTTSDSHLAQEFDNGAEVNYGIDSSGKAQSDGDVKWAGLQAKQQEALKRLYGWIRSCVPSGANPNDLSTFKSAKFVNEIDQYFNRKFLLTYYIFTDYFLSVDQRAKNMMLRTWDGKVWYITYYDGDTQLGKRNDCFLVYLYDTDRNTWDAEASKYAFEGHDSWLWNLVLANLGDDLKVCAGEFRAVMTNERVLAMLNDEQSGNWSDRAFNKSGYLKYIAPATKEMYGKVWPFIYALQGSNRSHRTFFIINRFALLDAKYGTSSFTSDNIDLYMARAATDAADTLRITANETYAFGYGTNNTPNIANTGIVAGNEVATLNITEAYTVNDPLRVYGASRIKVLDMTGAANHLKNALDLGKCTALRELNLQATGSGSTGWWLSIGSCKQLRKINLRNQSQAKTGSNTSTALDLSNQTKLEDIDARGTKVQSIQFAKGAPLTAARMPSTITTLRLEYLNKLTTSGLTLESYSNVRTLIFDSCPLINWETLLSRCTNVNRLRITGIDREDDGTWLNKFMSMGGVDSEGNSTDTCALVGTVRLTRYIDEDRYLELCAHFPELNIMQPEYTMIKRNIIVSDDKCITNLDNGTGYESGTEYVPSGHINAILAKRHRVLAKVTKKPTTRKVTIANVETTMNNLDGQMTYFPLHDADSSYYADAEDVRNCTPAKLDGSEGDWMMYEPDMWCKGVNDYLNDAFYSCYSSNDRDHKPACPEATILTLDDLKDRNDVMAGRKIVAKDTLASSYTTDTNYSVCKVDVKGFKRVRFPSVPGASLVGAVFCDTSGNVIESVIVPTLSSKFEAGMYLIKDIPANAATLHFSIHNQAEFDKVVLSNSDKIEDLEPEWYLDGEHLCGVVGTTAVGNKFRAAITGGSTTASMNWTDFHYYSAQRGMQQIDVLMHNRIANLFYAKYGRLDSQSQCGGGSHTNARTTGGTMKYGMQDTIGYDEAKLIKSDITNSVIDSVVHAYAWEKTTDSVGTVTVTQLNNINCLGYEDIYGHKYDMMDGVDVPNTTGNVGKWRIWMPDGTIRWVKGMQNSGWWITGVAHGLYMDMTPVGSVNGTSSSYFCDIYYFSGSLGRVVYRGYNNAYAYGGVSFTNAIYDASYTYAYVGSRLAFRGNLVKAQSVAAFKALAEAA